MRHIAVVGSGPAGYYTAESLQKSLGERVRIDILDRLPVPFGQLLPVLQQRACHAHSTDDLGIASGCFTQLVAV